MFQWAEEWSRLINDNMLQVNHRHVIFTVYEGLRVIFQKHRKLLKDLMNEEVPKYFSDLPVVSRIITRNHTFA